MNTIALSSSVQRASLFIATLFLIGMFFLPVQKAEAATIEELQAIVAQLMAQLAELQANTGFGTGSTGTASTTCQPFTRFLYIGARDATTNGEVSRLQEYLRSTGDYTYGSITGYYGPATQSAVQSWQARNGVVSYGTPQSTGYGLVGSQTRAALNRNCVQPTDPPEPTDPPALKPEVKVISPNGGESYGKDSALPIKYKTSYSVGTTLTAYLHSPIYAYVKTLTFPVQESGEYQMQLTKGEGTPVGQYKIFLCPPGVYSRSQINTMCDASDDFFTITEDTPATNPLVVTASRQEIESGSSIEYTISVNKEGASYIKLEHHCDPDGIEINAKGGSDGCGESLTIPLNGATRYLWTEWYTVTEDSSHTLRVKVLNSSYRTIAGPEEVTIKIKAIKTDAVCYYKPYDYDQNGKLTTADVEMLGKYLSSSCPSGFSCDVNRNGAFTIADVTALITIVNGGTRWCPKDTDPPEPEPVCYYKPYDLDSSGKLDGGDRTYIQQIILGNKTCPSGKVCDINGDGRVSVIDMSAHYNVQTGVTQCPVDTIPTPTPDPACYFSLYDYDNNGVIDKGDPALLITYLGVGSSCPSGKLCDINQNGAFTIADVTALTTLVNGDDRWCPVNKAACSPSSYDFNNDGKVTLEDAPALNDHIFVTGVCPTGKDCDVNNSGSMNISDITAFIGLANGDDRWCPKDTDPPEPEPVCYYKPYDYNDDGELDEKDSDMLGNGIIFGTNKCPTGKACDVDGNGSLNINDVLKHIDIAQGRAECPSTSDPTPSVCYYAPYDYNNDGVLNNADYQILQFVGPYGIVCPSGKICKLTADGPVGSFDLIEYQKILSGERQCPSVLGVSTSHPNLAGVIVGLERFVESLKEFISSR